MSRHPAGQTSRRLIIGATLAAVGLGAWLFYSAAHRASRGGQHTPLFSARRYDPYGTAALYELLQLRGVPVHFLQHQRPAPQDSGTLIQVLTAPDSETGAGGPARELDVESLREWIAAGNTVVQFCAAPTALLERCLPQVTRNRPDPTSWNRLQKRMQAGKPPGELGWQTVSARWIKEPAVLYAAAPPDHLPLELHSPWSLPAERSAVWQPLAAQGSQVVAGEQRIGQGRLIVVSSPTPVINWALDRSGNLDFILGVTGGRAVLIDEWSHGLGHGPTVVALLSSLGLLPAVVQVMLAVALYAWSTRGHPRQDVPVALRRRSSVEQVVTLGQLYSQALSTMELGRRTAQEIRRRLASALKCSMTDLDARLPRLRSAAAAEAVELLQDVAAVSVQPPAGCQACGYSLEGNVSGVCPECGAPDRGRKRGEARSAAEAGESSRHDLARAEALARRQLARSDHLAKELMRERTRAA